MSQSNEKNEKGEVVEGTEHLEKESQCEVRVPTVMSNYSNL